MVIELSGVQFWSEIILVISNRTRAARSFDFEITRMISDQIALHSVQLPLFIIWLLVKFCLRDTAGSPERVRWLHLARLGSQSQRAIWFILPAQGVSHIINHLTILCIVVDYLFLSKPSCSEKT